MTPLFPQSAYILMRGQPSLDELETALSELKVLGRTQGNQDQHWSFDGDSLVVALEDYAGTGVVVDIVARPWTDAFGDPEKDPLLFGAWSAGAFGPAVFPGALGRAIRHAWAWRAARSVVPMHESCIRVRLTRMGEDEEGEAPLDAALELKALSAVAAALLQVEGALAYFNPNGESLRPREFVNQTLVWHEANEMLPLDLWTNVRIGRAEDAAEWMVMDCVGMSQLGRPDVEVCFKDGSYPYEQMDEFIRNVSQYLCENGDVVAEGDALDGPGGVEWQVMRPAGPLAMPPREVIRLFPLDGTEAPAVLKGGEPETTGGTLTGGVETVAELPVEDTEKGEN